MKVLLLSTNESKGGAAMVTLRLTRALRDAGIDARMLVGNGDCSEPWISRVGQLRLKTAKVAERGEIFLNNGLDMHDLWKVSSARFGAGVCNHKWVKEADVIVLNWVNQGLMSLADIEALVAMNKPVVWWMHDLWCATGICHLPGDCLRFEGECGDCPFLHGCARPADLSRKVWERKMRVFANSGIRFVAVSRWQRDVALRSSLLGGMDIEVIPHAFPVEDYDFKGVQGEKRTIVMGAARLDDAVKNLPLAVESLNRFKASYPQIAAQTEAVFFGGLRDASIFNALELPHRYLGPLDADSVRRLYSSASVVLSTSRFETMGATLMEGMAAGAIPVTFATGGQGDIVTHGENGFIATTGSADSVASCLAAALAPEPPFAREAQHLSVAARFSAPAVANRFITLFKSLLINR